MKTYKRIHMRFFLLAVCCCMAQYAISQSKLTGKIIDSVTKQPIANASIFLSHTTIGTVSNENGEFILDHIPYGKFELVIASLNYENYISSYSNFITGITNASPAATITIQLKPAENILKEVIVESYDKDGWKRWGTYFKDQFIGNFSLIKNCKLLNPDVLKFRLNKKTNILRAFAHEKLVFENKSLGYRVKYLLTRFEVDFNANTFKYIGYPLFEKMIPKNPGEQKKWDTARAEIYRGSLRHFMRSLYNNQLVKEGFEVRAIKTVTQEEKERVKEIMLVFDQMQEAGLKPRLRTNPDSLDYYKKVVGLPDTAFRFISGEPIPRDSLVVGLDSSAKKEVVLFYFDGFLHIGYRHKREPYDYPSILQKTSDKTFISTDIALLFPERITIFRDGNYYNGENLLIDGYWSWSEKLSTMLPSDYWPDEKNN